MAYFEDLRPCGYFGKPEGNLLAVGWLDRGHPFPKGDVSRSFFDALSELLSDPWQPFAVAGRHACELCVFTGGPAALRVRGISVALGASNVFVPGRGVVYVAPSLIVHSIDAHQYAPPEEFQRAVEACPPMRSMPYLKALCRHGVHRLGRANED